VIALPEHARVLAASPDGATLAIAGYERIYTVELASGAVRLLGKGRAEQLVWCDDGVLAIAYDRVKRVGGTKRKVAGGVAIGAQGTREATLLLDANGATVGTLPFQGWNATLRGGMIATRDVDGVRLVALATREAIAHHPLSVDHVALSPDGSRIVA